MSQGAFAARVGAFASKTKERMTAVRNAAVERTIEEMQTPVAKGGRLPVDTGFLRASLQVTTGAPIPAVQPNPGAGAFSYSGQQVVTVLSGAPLDAVIYAAYGAAYSVHVNYGARGAAPRRFVDLAAQNWPRNVEDAVKELEFRLR
ncbi:MAG: hypothetical protein WC972_04830 [Trueperaceae bacterium]